MADVCIRGVVEAIHSSPTQAVRYLSGGASQALGWLMSVPGVTNTVLEAVVPYSRISMIQLLGEVPAQFASRKTAEDVALMVRGDGLFSLTLSVRDTRNPYPQFQIRSVFTLGGSGAFGSVSPGQI